MNQIVSKVIRTYQGSDGEATKALYARLLPLGPAGDIAVNLFRAQKASERAKVYSRRYRGHAYDKKQWSMDNLCEALALHAASIGLTWGWGLDDKQALHCHVLYIELPTGQVSFHTENRGKGPDYLAGWDNMVDKSPDRIIRWVARILNAELVTS